MLRLTDYSTIVLETTPNLTPLMYAFWVGVSVGALIVLSSFEALVHEEGQVRSILLAAAGGFGVLLVVVGLSCAGLQYEESMALENKTRTNVQEWLEDGYGIAATHDDIDQLIDGESLVVTYDGEPTTIMILGAAGEETGDEAVTKVAVVRSGSTTPLQPIR